nr:unnamed protein product [Callosobruchus analis]
MFRQLLNKVKFSLKSGDGRDDIFKSSWFAYETMENFLQPVYSARDTINTEVSSYTYASGADQIPAIVHKRCGIELTPILCKPFKVSYEEQGIFSAAWKIGCVQPITKKGKNTNPTNY